MDHNQADSGAEETDNMVQDQAKATDSSAVQKPAVNGEVNGRVGSGKR